MPEKREQLKHLMVQTVVNFVNREGGITPQDLSELFGYPDNFNLRVASALACLEIKFSGSESQGAEAFVSASCFRGQNF